MKIFKWIRNFFNFGAKYKKEEEKYHQESYKNGPAGHLANLILMAFAPILGLLGAIYLSWEIWPAKILCIMLSFIIIETPAKLLIYGIVALRHRLRMRIQNKLEDKVYEKLTEGITGQELTKEEKQNLENKKAKGTSDKMDLAIGIIAIILSIAVIIAFATIFICWFANLIKSN